MKDELLAELAASLRKGKRRGQAKSASGTQNENG